MRVEELAKSLDLVLLSPLATPDEVGRSCDEAIELHLAAVRTYPGAVADAADRLRGTDVKTGVTVGLPFGCDDPAVKAAAADRAVRAGASEVSVVMNVPAFLGGRFTEARDDLSRVVRAARGAATATGRGTVIVTAIIEAPLLDDKLTRMACRVVVDSGVDFAGTGSGGGVARPQDVELMRESLPGDIGVTAAGGVATLDEAMALLDAGAVRVGSSVAVELVREMATTAKRR